jgi:hypothetical protein
VILTIPTEWIIHPEADFNYVQKICRYQGCEMYLYDIEYEDAIYQAFLLQQEDSSNLYLKRCNCTIFVWHEYV